MANATVPTRREEDFAREGCLGLGSITCAVDPEATGMDLLEDVNCLFGAAMSALGEVDVDKAGEGAESWWAALYTLRLARTAFAAAYDRVHIESLELRQYRAAGARP